MLFWFSSTLILVYSYRVNARISFIYIKLILLWVIALNWLTGLYHTEEWIFKDVSEKSAFEIISCLGRSFMKCRITIYLRRLAFKTDPKYRRPITKTTSVRTVPTLFMSRILNSLYVQAQQVHHTISLRIPTLYFFSYGVTYIHKYSLLQVNIHAVRGCWHHFLGGKATEAWSCSAPTTA
jgi:hypothetical protein